MTDIENTLERGLDRFSFDALPTSQRLAEFLAVQNTYLSMFQILGGIGLLLGTAGLATVMLRNIGERRGELSLMRTLGFSNAAVAGLVLFENAALLVTGLLVGCLAASVAIAPVMATEPTSVPWRSLAVTPVLKALRSE